MGRHLPQDSGKCVTRTRTVPTKSARTAHTATGATPAPRPPPPRPRPRAQAPGEPAAFPRRGAGTGEFTTPGAHSRGGTHARELRRPRPSAPAGSAAPAQGGGGRAPGREGVRRPPARRTDLLRDPRVAPSGCPCSAASGSGRPAASDGVSTARQLAPAPAGEAATSGGSAPVKERAGASSPRDRRPLCARSSAYRPPTLSTYRPPRRPSTSTRATHPTRPAHLIYIPPAHLICISLWIFQSFPPRRGRDAPAARLPASRGGR